MAIRGNVEEQQSIIVLMKNQIAKVYGIQTGEALSSKPAAVSKINVYHQTMHCIFDSAKKIRRPYEGYSEQLESLGLDEA